MRYVETRIINGEFVDYYRIVKEGFSESDVIKYGKVRLCCADCKLFGFYVENDDGEVIHREADGALFRLYS